MKSRAFVQRFMGALGLSSAILMSACGGGSSAGGNETASGGDDQAELLVSLTDAEGDFLSYAVDLDSIVFERSDGATVEVLPQETRVDFAQYVDVSELLTRVSVPPGRYDSVALNLDFSASQITVQSETGEAIPATAVDAEGLTLGEYSVDLGFEEGFTITRGRLAHVVLDFDLDASNTITIDGDSAEVEVEPVFDADTMLDDPKPSRLRGLLSEVDTENSVFELELRPFSQRSGRFGEVNIYIDDDTEFEIDGEAVANDSGLNAMASLELETPVVAQGTWDTEERRFVADEVLAGSSVPWDNASILRGTVIARVGNEVSVRGGIVELESGEYSFHETLTMTVSDDTPVLRRGEEPGIEAISIGSRIRATGELVDDETWDLSAGTVRVKPGTISGQVVSESPLAISLNFVNGRRAALFDFTGTGSELSLDADPAFYELAFNARGNRDIELSDPVRALGFVRNFGQAPEDFDAQTLVNAADVRGHMVVAYGETGAADVLTVTETNELALDLDAATGRHHLSRVGIPVDLKSFEDAPVVGPVDEGGVYSISGGQRIQIFQNFDLFVDAVLIELEGGANIKRFDAHGFYENMDNSFTARKIRIHLHHEPSEDTNS